MKLYLQGRPSADGTCVQCPLSSSAIIFVIRYCQVSAFELVFISDTGTSDKYCCTLGSHNFSDLTVTFMLWNEMPELIRNVSLPSLHQPQLRLVRSGLCVLLRHIIKESHASAPHLHLIDLLGFRQGSMKMCAEVSGFTKLCEVELPQSVSQMMLALGDLHPQKERDCAGVREIVLPSSIIKLECHFQKKCRVHNDDKRRRNELAQMKKYFSDFCEKETSPDMEKAIKIVDVESVNQFLVKNYRDIAGLAKSHQLHDDNAAPLDLSSHIDSTSSSLRTEIEKLSYSNSRLQIDQVTHLHHGIRRMKVDKQFDFSLNSRNINHRIVDENRTKASENVDFKSHDGVNVENRKLDFTTANLADIGELVEKLTYVDIEYEHTYSEGIEMTLADLILYVYIYHMLEALDFSCISLVHHLPRILRWTCHMTSIATVMDAGVRCGWHMEALAACLNNRYNATGAAGCSGCVHRHRDVAFVKELETVEDADEMELSRCARMKHKALKPEVVQALRKFEDANIQSVTGNHPCGDQVKVNWTVLPAGIHPREGDVPESRTLRKCQQLENLVTAVQTLAKAGSVLVDFCSGGGHLGIVMAYLLPECQVYLVENKEESLLKACSRLESLDLNNVTMYQCNLDYFIGSFDVGVCLHACGSATDMVLQLCLNSRASFVICPCCYGSIQKTHLLSYPRSQQFIKAGITYKDFLTLGHAADQTEFNIVLEERGRQCMNLVDTDRADYAREFGYSVTLCSLKPLSCTPKNNLLIGTVNKE